MVEELSKLSKDELYVTKVKAVYEAMSNIVTGENVEVTYSISDKLENVGFVDIKGENIEILDTEIFANCCMLASDYEVSARIDGDVLMCLYFTDLEENNDHSDDIKIKCFDVAQMIISEVTEELCDNVREDMERMEEFMNICAIIDDVCSEHDGAAYGCEVDQDSLDISITMHCPYFEVSGCDNKLYELFKLSKKYNVVKSEEVENGIAATFIFEGVWVPIK